MKKNTSLPEFQMLVNEVSKQKAVADYAMSRLDAGVHTFPAIRDGSVLCKGLGKNEFQNVTDLFEGRVP